MSPGNDPSTILTLGFGPLDTYQMGEYALFEVLCETSSRHSLGANVDWAVSRYGAKDRLDKYASATESMVRVNTGETVNPATGGAARPFVLWPRYEGGDVRIFVCSKVTMEDIGKSRVLYDGDQFARDILTGIPRVVMHFQDNFYGKSDLPQEAFLEYDHAQGVFHLPRDLRSDRSTHASVAAMGNLVKGLWENGLEIPIGTYMDLAINANKDLIV